jgi:hypothetical protein
MVFACSDEMPARRPAVLQHALPDLLLIYVKLVTARLMHKVTKAVIVSAQPQVAVGTAAVVAYSG